MKNTLSLKVGVAVATVAFLGMPLFVQAQYGPPPGYEGMTPPSGFEGMTPPSDQMGPPADLQEKLSKGLARLKKGAISMARAVKAMEKAVAGAEKVGYVTPDNIKNSILKAKAAIETINGATSLEDDGVQQAIDDFDAFTEVLDANIENLSLIPRFQKVIKSADVQLVKLVKFFDSTKARLVDLEVDTASVIAEVQAKVDQEKAYLDQAKALSLQGKMEEAFALLEDNYFPGLETTSQSIGALNALNAVTRTASGVSRGIKTAERIIARLELAKINVSALKTIVADSKAKLEELKLLLKTPGYDLDAVMALLSQLDALREDFDTKVDQAVGDMDVNLPNVKMFTSPATPMPMTMRKGFDKYQDSNGGFKGEGAPSESMGIDMGGY